MFRATLPSFEPLVTGGKGIPFDYSVPNVGVEITSLAADQEFQARPPHPRDAARQLESMQMLAQALVDAPDTVLRELVNAAIHLCGAESAGISVVRTDGTADDYYEWVAAAGTYQGFLDAHLPQYPSACGVCLERNQPQHFRVDQPFFDHMGIDAPPVADGILLPWHAESLPGNPSQSDSVHGTIWIISHTRPQAFDSHDAAIMATLANFVSMSVRQQRQQLRLRTQAAVESAAAMANQLAHEINNPLQSLTNLIYLATEEPGKFPLTSVTEDLRQNVDRLSALVGKLLALPVPG